MNHRIAHRNTLGAARQVAIVASLILLSSLPVWGQASQVPNALQQFGGPTAPYANGSVFMYVPNTFTKKSTWNGPDQSHQNTNPILLDSAGRANIWGVGSYRQVLFDKFNNQVWDNLTIAPPVASTAAASGSGDFLPLGAILPIGGFTAPTNYLLAFGQAVSRVTYAGALAVLTISSPAACINGNATITGITSTAQMRIGAPIEASCLSSGTTIASIVGPTSITVSPVAAGTASVTIQVFNYGNGDAVTTFNLPDLRGRVLPGADAMGGTPANILTSAYYGVSAAPPGAASTNVGGSQTMLTANLPAIKPAITITDPGHTHTYISPASAANFTATGAGSLFFSLQTLSTGSSTTGVTAAFTSNLGSATPFSIIQPSLTINYAIKVLNGTLPVVGVLSLGGLTGDILCGTGITCVGNTISAGGLSFGTMATQNANAVAITGGTITGMPTPTNPTDVAIKSYVDATAVGRTPLAPVRLATTAVLSNTPTYANGAAGVGRTLTAGSNGILSVDATVVALNDRVLVKNQAAQLQNGCYTLTTVGTVSVAYVLTGCTDADTAAEMPNGLTTLVTAGATLVNGSWTLNQPNPITVGTTALPWLNTQVGSVSYWTLSGSDIFNNNAGKVGVGTTTPGAQLHAQATTTGAQYIGKFTSGGSTTGDSPMVAWTRADGTVDLNILGNQNGMRIKSGPNLFFHTGDTNPTAAGFVMAMTTAGLVGIGTTTPTSVLDVNFSGAAAMIRDSSTPGNQALLQANSSLGPILAGHTDASGNSTINVAAQMLSIGGSGFQISNSPATAVSSPRVWTPRVTLDVNSRLGIGTTSPAAGASVQVGSVTPTSVYVNSSDPTMQQAVCYGFGAGNCETDAFLSHLRYTGAATVTGAAVRGEVDMFANGKTALGVSGVTTNSNSGSSSELVGVIGVSDWHGGFGSGNAVWAITEGDGCGGGNTLCGGISATNGGSFAPSWGMWCAFEGTATQSFDTCFKGEGFVTYGLRLSNTNTAPWPIYINNNVGTQIYGVNSAGVVTSASDARLKNDKGKVADGALARVVKLVPRKFAWKSDAAQVETEGFFAQEVENVIPAAVSQTEDGSGYLMLNQLPVLAEAVKAIQELKADNDNLRACQNSWKCRIFGIQ